jgi:hypothetical protein
VAYKWVLILIHESDQFTRTGLELKKLSASRCRPALVCIMWMVRSRLNRRWLFVKTLRITDFCTCGCELFMLAAIQIRNGFAQGASS